MDVLEVCGNEKSVLTKECGLEMCRKSYSKEIAGITK